MFQSLTGKCMQLIASFTLKIFFEDEEFMKLILKAIHLMKKIEITMHGIIRDGASARKKIISV